MRKKIIIAFSITTAITFAVSVAMLKAIDLWSGKEMIKKESEIKVGDKVQWLSQGVYQFAKPRVVLEIMDSAYGKYVIVEGSLTGLPLNQIKKI